LERVTIRVNFTTDKGKLIETPSTRAHVQICFKPRNLSKDALSKPLKLSHPHALLPSKAFPALDKPFVLCRPKASGLPNYSKVGSCTVCCKSAELILNVGRCLEFWDIDEDVTDKGKAQVIRKIKG